jgi:parvulin-like peptidyl-prolyl isomerase
MTGAGSEHNTSGEERVSSPDSFETPMRIQLAGLIHLILSVSLMAQLAPVPSHNSRRSSPADGAVVARVNGVPILGGDLAAALNTVVPLTSYHENVKPEKMDELRARALDSLIDEELRYQEAVRLKVRVPPAEVEHALERARKAYRTTEEFERARRESGATMPQLRASILRALMIGKIYEQVVRSQCAVTEDEAATYYRENTARFVQPEQMRTSIITIGVDRSAPPPEWEQARHQAEDLARQLAAGASFETLAREHSTDPSKAKGGDLGFVHRGQMIDEFERALTPLRPGQVSPVVQTIYGFHLLRLVEIRSATQKTFAEMKSTIVRDLTETRCNQATAEWSVRLRKTARIEIIDERHSGARMAG